MTLLVHWIALSLLLFPQSYSGAQKTDRDEDGLRGNVRSVLSEIALLTDENGRVVEGQRFGAHVTRYDERGNRTEAVHYMDRLIDRRDIHSRDAQGNHITRTYQSKFPKPGDPGPPKPGQDPLPTTLTCSVKRDIDGNTIEETCYAEDGKPSSRTVYTFDSQKKTREVSEYGHDSTLDSKCTEEYGADGQVTSTDCHYFSNPLAEEVRQTFTYEFDSHGNWVKRFGSGWQKSKGRTLSLGKDVVYRTISYDGSKDVRPDIGSKLVDPLPAMTGPMVIRKSGGVLQQSATRIAKPVYPNDALVAGLSGAVVVEVKVDERGKVESADAISGPPELRQAAVDAARQWEFKPTTLSGVPVKVIGRITFNFTR